MLQVAEWEISFPSWIAVRFSHKANDVTGVRLDMFLKILFPLEELSLLGPFHTWVTESKLDPCQNVIIRAENHKTLGSGHPVLATAQL